jgi:NitT/TauT family transport system substrate-binding protein
LAIEFAPSEEVVSMYELSLLFFGDKLRQERADVARRFMRAFLRANRDYLDALENGRWRTDGGADEIIGIFSRKLNIPLDLARSITPQATDPNGKPALESIARDLAFFQEQGEVANKALRVEDCIDLSFAEAAARELGPWQRRK